MLNDQLYHRDPSSPAPGPWGWVLRMTNGDGAGKPRHCEEGRSGPTRQSQGKSTKPGIASPRLAGFYSWVTRQTESTSKGTVSALVLGLPRRSDQGVVPPRNDKDNGLANWHAGQLVCLTPLDPSSPRGRGSSGCPSRRALRLGHFFTSSNSPSTGPCSPVAGCSPAPSAGCSLAGWPSGCAADWLA